MHAKPMHMQMYTQIVLPREMDAKQQLLQPHIVAIVHLRMHQMPKNSQNVFLIQESLNNV